MKTKLICLIVVLIGLQMALVSADAQDKKAPPAPPSPGQVWDDIKHEWKKIGEDTKQTGTEIGQKVSKEAQAVPGQFRQGIEDAKKDFKKLTDPSRPAPDLRKE